MKHVRDKVAVVIGGGSGVGRGVALACVEAGMHVVVADIHEESAELVSAELRAAGGRSIAFRADATDEASLDSLADAATSEFGGIHVLSNNAGVIQLVPGIEASDDDWRYVLDVNVMGTVKGCRVFAPRMIEQGEGHLVNTASMAGLVADAVPMLSLYTTSKHAVLGLCETLRGELEAHNVRVSCVCPGLVESNLSLTSLRNRSERYGRASVPVGGGSGGALPGAMSSELCGRLVVAGIQADRFLILTHPEAWPMLEARLARFRSDFKAAERLKAEVMGA
jgi:NAD(P)-dependent dehydrogenase (short-subunit alcohol dehydrogenase family)